eukprot:CAMPEP_0171077640 /NCGR_PEP_ID=MMETSP0766_2-20121228/14153_1 /TAXON_ID=439317 /ORGANISM="Gambierdiscus australes, Strain CAWD 149" /LENGTH=68 /DNA_ID=CAMNT_0011534713 /DNA_START=289 /DNA_END=494 /DNA_ORIENTATION=-
MSPTRMCSICFTQNAPPKSFFRRLREDEQVSMSDPQDDEVHTRQQWAQRRQRAEDKADDGIRCPAGAA